MNRSQWESHARRVGRSRPYRWKVTDRMWDLLAGFLADPPRNARYPGRPRYAPRQCLEGILYVLFTGTPWLELPYRELGLPSGETCRRRLEEWTRRGLLPRVAADRRRVAGAGEKGGAKVARTLLGGAGSRFHLAVDAAGAPLEVRLAAGNENERQHLLPVLDALAARKIQPAQLWADRGYASRELEQQLRQRGIEPRISQPRRAGQPIPPGTPSRAVWRGRRRRIRTADPQAKHRWPIERTNAWLKSMRRIATRYDRKPDNYLAFLQIAIIVILLRHF